ncbi:MAG TPA: ABC transporter ATP-binding protein [Gemmatimonadaceae bacterium]|nr:ABC transporter ATP-binding protein [Gemmatimonadaceae bacterium]
MAKHVPTLSSLRRLLPYYRPYRRSVAWGLVLVAASAAFSSVVPWFLRRALDGIRNHEPIRSIWLLAGAMIAASLIGGVGRFWMRQLLNAVSRWMEFDLRNDLFRNLERLDATYYTRVRTGDLMARLTNDLSAVRMAAGPAIMYLTNTIAGGAFALAFMLRISPKLTLVAALPMALLPALGLLLGRHIHNKFEAVQAHFSDLTTLAQENLAGVRIVRAFRQERAEMDRFATLNEGYLEKNMKLIQLYGLMQPGFSVFAGLGMVAVLGFGGVFLLNGSISVGSFVAFGMYLGMLTWPLIALGWVINLFQRGAASMSRLLDVLDAKPELPEPATPRALPPAVAGRSIEFRNVGFHYAGDPGHEPRWVLRDISFTAPAGATIGVVGATGSGKSALMDLVPRLFDPQEGEILVDGVPIREVDLSVLRREIGYVPQESFLFSDTIGSNLTYGEQQGGDDTAKWAAAIAQLDDTIEQFPGGYDTLLGERGINLSGGQKQRAALARALARRPSIVLLDDALSAVDTHTEAEILRSLRSALAGRTAMIASHRVSAIRDASWIIVLDEGRIVEQGRHAELLAAGGRYWALLNRQQLEDAIEAEGELAEAATEGTINA